MNLIIVESPTKARTLARFLGKEYKIESSMGHLRDLPKKTLAIEVEHDFKPDYVLVKGKEEVIKKLKDEAKKAATIYLATDPDREGEAIAYHVKYLLKESGKNKKFLRIVFHEITKGAVEQALASPGEIDLKLVDAQQTRRILDRLVGYKLSPLLWVKIRRGLSAGRVQSVAVRLIVEKEREIEKFVPEEYWRIEADLGRQDKEEEHFLALLMEKNGQKLKVGKKDEAEKIVEELKKAGFAVSKVEKKELKKSPPPPFITSTLQQAGVNRMGWSGKKTMRMAQQLYEKGLITYHRTDSTALSAQAIKEVRTYINSIFGGKYLPEKERIYRSKSKFVQAAHEAIRPTSVKRTEEEFEEKGERILYGMIWRRFVACQMAAALVDKTVIDVEAEGGENVYLLRAEGEIEKFDGFRKIYGAKRDEENLLPEVKEGEELKLLDLMSEQKFTEPPPRYTEATLIKTLEKMGIGRPSTYAPIVFTIQVRMYVERKEKFFYPTALGIAVNDFLVEFFPKIMDYQFTAQLEDGLDEIALGKIKWVPFLKEFYKPFSDQLEGVFKAAERVKVPVEATEERCPQCGAMLIVRVGRFGKFLACSKFPECKFTKPYTEVVEGVKCPKCKGEVIIRWTKKKKRFYGCSNYPKCQWASWRRPQV